MYYQSQLISVSQARISIKGMDYPIRNISAVGLETKQPSMVGAVLSMLAGILLCIGAIVGYVVLPADVKMVMMTVLFGGLFWAGLAVYLFSSAKPAYHLVFQTNSGQVDAYSSRNGDEMSAIKAAINQAIDAQY